MYQGQAAGAFVAKERVFWLFSVLQAKPFNFLCNGRSTQAHLHPSGGSTSVAVFLWKKHGMDEKKLGSRLLYIPASCDLTFVAWAEFVACMSGLYSVKRHGLWANIPNCSESPSRHITTSRTSVNLWRFH